jgi:hypothetical protein
MACIVQPTSLGSLHIESYAVHQASFSAQSCPIALSLDRVGTGWNIMGAARLGQQAFHAGGSGGGGQPHHRPTVDPAAIDCNISAATVFHNAQSRDQS